MANPAWLDAAQTLAKTLRKSSAYSGPKYLEPGLNPPTNSWISGIVFAENPIWTLTGLTIKPTGNGFGLHLVRPYVWGDKAMIGAYSDEKSIVVKLGSATTRTVSYYDDAAVKIRYRSGSQVVGHVTAAQGWPYVLVSNGGDTSTTTVTISRAGATIAPFSRSGVSAYLLTEADGAVYLITTPDAAQISGSTLTTSVGQGKNVYIAGLPNSQAGTINAFIDGRTQLSAVKTTFSVDKNAKKVRTTLSYSAGASATTVVGYLPHQKPVDTSLVPLGTFTTVLGPVTFYRTNKVDFESKMYDTTKYALDLSPLSATDKTTLKSLVKADITKLTFPGDTYFGGKALFRATNLLVLATQLGLTTEATALAARLTGELALWFDTKRTNTHSDKTFVYDENLVGVVGLAPGFGSDSSFNDHHFHYGYLLYAAGVLATGNPALVEKYRPIADLLLADIAAPVSTETTIARRSFDDYAGHSWANGIGGGPDGNDQESTAEAINAWSGASLWAQASGNTEALDQAIWMASVEAQTAKQYWFNPYVMTGFKKPHISMVFAGKSDYGTWFSGDRSDITGIQIIPMSAPVAEHLRDLGATRIKELFNSVLAENSTISGRSHLIDWNIMFLSLADKAAALNYYKQLQDSDIDNGNTRSHMFATILSGSSGTAPVIDVGTSTGAPDPTPDPAPVPDPVPPTPTPTSGRYKTGDSIPVHFSIGTNGTPRTVVYHIASGAEGGTSGLVSIEINGNRYATVAVSNTAGWDKFIDVRGDFPNLHGEVDGFIRFTSSQPSEFVALDKLTLEGVDSTVTLGTTPPPDPDPEPDPDPVPTEQRVDIAPGVVLVLHPDHSVTWDSE